VTILNVHLTVESRAGRRTTGFGSMPLGNVWAWPSRILTYQDTLARMKFAVERLANLYSTYSVSGHPIRITSTLEHEFPRLARESADPREPMPLLALLVVASAFDAALHDAYGKSHGLNCYQTYQPPFFSDDLGDYLGSEFRGEKLERYLNTHPQPAMPLYHLVGALDPLSPGDLTSPVRDGLPETLGEWITRDGLTHLKIKLNGDDAQWDVERILGVDAVATTTAPDRAFAFSLDFNERCQNVEYLLEVLRQVQARSTSAFDRIQYIEQPTARDLKAHPGNLMHEAARLKPVVIDESLLDLETLLLARDQGYTGVAFKACKGQTQSLLLAVAAQKYGLYRCVQDLTCPGASLIHSAGLAAHIPGVAAIESNSRQYCPAANTPWEAEFPGIFRITDGRMNTGLLTRPGLSAVPMA
jgi:L-alanine-DL-glutamate epimerase-like enolase superfamily enzyme